MFWAASSNPSDHDELHLGSIIYVRAGAYIWRGVITKECSRKNVAGYERKWSGGRGGTWIPKDAVVWRVSEDAPQVALEPNIIQKVRSQRDKVRAFSDGDLSDFQYPTTLR